jgi:hypothetical protein
MQSEGIMKVDVEFDDCAKHQNPNPANTPVIPPFGPTIHLIPPIEFSQTEIRNMNGRRFKLTKK